VRGALERFPLAVGAGDAAAVEALLAEDVRQLSDGGGEFHAARQPVVGGKKVARFFLGVARGGGAAARVDPRSLNGEPAVLLELPPERRVEGFAPRLTLHARLDGRGRIAELYAVLASAKLSHVARARPGAVSAARLPTRAAASPPASRGRPAE
jgi:RNA polymerase sigma-70 factor (ECF subfamily)